MYPRTILRITYTRSVRKPYGRVLCFAQQLNIVIVDTFSIFYNRCFFFLGGGNLQELVNLMRARKITAVFNYCQNKLNVESKVNERIRQIKGFTETKRTSPWLRIVLFGYEKFNELKNCFNDIDVRKIKYLNF